MLFETACSGCTVSIGLILKGSSGIEEGRRYLTVQISQGSGVYLELPSLLEGTGGSSNSFATVALQDSTLEEISLHPSPVT